MKEIVLWSYISEALKAGNIPPEDEFCRIILLRMAIKAAHNAYCPYSKFQVGAAMLTDRGAAYEGCNVENVMYNGMSHAELTAISHAIVKEGPGMKIVSMVIWTPTDIPTPSCGGCRQLIREHAECQSTMIWSYCKHPKVAPLGLTVEELLPNSFGPEML